MNLCWKNFRLKVPFVCLQNISSSNLVLVGVSSSPKENGRRIKVMRILMLPC